MKNYIRDSFIDDELENILEKKIKSLSKKCITVGVGITSSHLGDERNLREFLLADEVVKYLRYKGYNVLFLLVDDSFDILNFRQLRVAVNKDEKLIKKFEKYCGMPIKLIPDPYKCHVNYSEHFQNEILDRLYSLNIHPNIIDSYSAYDSGLYDFAKEIVFTRMDEIKKFLKMRFPNYETKKIYWPLCPKCLRLDTADIKTIQGEKVEIECSNCKIHKTLNWKDLKGKFGWKLDTAIKWNVFNFNFEPFSKAYLDPDVGSYVIAKSLSDEFFGGSAPEIIEYGQVSMERSLSYALLSSLPIVVMRSLFLQRRKRDILLTEAKVLQIARDCKIDEVSTFYDYVTIRLPYEIIENLNKSHVDRRLANLLQHGIAFAKKFLKRDVFPKMPQKEFIRSIEEESMQEIVRLYNWIIEYRLKHMNGSYEVFVKNLNKFLIKNKISKSHLFPIIRQVLLQEEGVPLSRIFYFLSLESLYASLFIIEKERK
jgi:hypothetical protein